MASTVSHQFSQWRQIDRRSQCTTWSTCQTSGGHEVVQWGVRQVWYIGLKCVYYRLIAFKVLPQACLLFFSFFFSQIFKQAHCLTNLQAQCLLFIFSFQQAHCLNQLGLARQLFYMFPPQWNAGTTDWLCMFKVVLIKLYINLHRALISAGKSLYWNTS